MSTRSRTPSPVPVARAAEHFVSRSVARPPPTFPAPRFPAGVAAPVLVLVVGLVLLAGVAAVALRGSGERVVPPAVTSAQYAAASAAAADLSSQAARATDSVVAEATRRAPGLVADPEGATTEVERAVPALSGVTVLDARTGAPVAQRGAPPGERGLPPRRAVVSTTAEGAPRIVVSVPIADDRTVVAATDLRLPPVPVGAPASMHTVLVGATGSVLGSAGSVPTGERPREVGVITRAAARSEHDDEGDVADVDALADADRDPRLPVASGYFVALAVSPGAGSESLAVVALAPTGPQVAPPARPGLLLAVGIVALAALAGLVLRQAVVRPVRRLRDDVVATLPDTAGATRGTQAAREPPLVRRSIVGEVDAVSTAVRRALDLPRDEPLPVRVRARVLVPAVAVVVVAVLVGAASLAGLSVQREEIAPADASARTDTTLQLAREATDDVRTRLETGAARVARAAGPQPAGSGVGGLARQADLLAATPDLFRSVSVVDAGGETRHTAGRPPLRSTEPIPAGVGLAQLNTSGRLPVLVAHGAAPGGLFALVAEFDVMALSDLLRREDTRMLVVDQAQRTLLDSRGFEAFRALTDPALAAAATVAQGGTPSASPTSVDGAESAVVSLPVGGPDGAAWLGWALIAHRDAGAEALRHDSAGRAALVVAGAGSALTVATLAWLWLVVLGPLRRAAREPDHVHGVPVDRPVEHLDEVGAVTAGLNALRRTASSGGH